MVRSTITCFFVVVTLIINESPKCYGPKVHQLCTNEIREIFKAKELESPGKAPISFFAESAFLYLRISENASLDTFSLNARGEHNHKDSKAYYLMLRDYIIVGPDMMFPVQFCQRRHAEVNAKPYIFLDPDDEVDPNIVIAGNAPYAYTDCLMQIRNYRISKTDDLPQLLYEVYDRVDIRTIDRAHAHAIKYVEHVAASSKLSVL